MKLRNKKTGERGILALNNSEGEIEIVVLEPDMPLCGNSVLARYDSLTKLSEEWEDYEPKEPLIKDSRACKIIRDWYEYHDTNLPIYCEDACTLSIDHSARIEFQERVFRNLEQDYRYAITELCGEEE